MNSGKESNNCKSIRFCSGEKVQFLKDKVRFIGSLEFTRDGGCELDVVELEFRPRL